MKLIQLGFVPTEIMLKSQRKLGGIEVNVHNQQEIAGSLIERCLRQCEIDIEEYRDVIRALFQAAPKDRARLSVKNFDSKGSPLANASVSRNFHGVNIAAEDRGPMYAVWVTRIGEESGLQDVLQFAEFPWGQILTESHPVNQVRPG